MTQLLIATALALTAGDLEHIDNFAENPSFEEDTNRDDGPDGWQPMAFDSPAKLDWDLRVARSGKRSLRIHDSFREGDQSDWKTCTGRWVSSPRPVTPGSPYTLDVWIKTQDVTGSAYAHLAWQRGSSWLSEDATLRVSGTEDWQKVSVSATAPDNADSLIVSVNLTRSRGTAWFDDIRVSGRSEMPPEVPYSFNDTSNWFPFEFPLDDTNLDSIDLTGLLDAPAGKHGFVTVGEDGHFYFEDGGRARFFGTNVGGAACAPDKARAPGIAVRLAKYGVNMLRLHSMDGRWGPLIDYRNGTSQEFDPDALDRIDFFVCELKKRGIYVYMDLLDYRWFRTGDGVVEGDQFTHNWQGSMKGASIFDERMIQLQKDYAAKLLTHRNPYTQVRYVDEPAVAVIETTNENSIFYFFRNAELSRPVYRDALSDHWNLWLLKRYGNRKALEQAWTDADGRSALQPDEDPHTCSVLIPFGMQGRIPSTADDGPYDPMLAAPRVGDLLRFFSDVQRHYYREMYGHLKELGVRIPIAGTNQAFSPADTFVEAGENDFMSRNQYWRHPHRNARPFFKFANDPLLRVDIPTVRNPLSVIARTSVAGKPQAVAEFNFPWPNEYRAEGLLMAAAYSCLQDWDIFLLFSYDLSDRRLSMFRSQSDPARWGEFPAAAMMFHRGDVSRAKNEVHVIHTEQDRFAPQPDTQHAKYSNHRFLTFMSKVRTGFVDDTYDGSADAILACGLSADAVVPATTNAIRLPQRPWETWLYPDFVQAARKLELPGYEQMSTFAQRFDSDTGELSLAYGQGLFIINTPCTKAIVGFLAEAGPQQGLSGFQVDCQTEFAAITASSLDGRPLGAARRVLLTSVGRAENTAQGYWPPTAQQRKWSVTSWMLPGEGRLPVIAEPIDAKVSIPMPGAATVYPLDPTGKRLSPLQADIRNGHIIINPADAQTIWCEIIVP